VLVSSGARITAIALDRGRVIAGDAAGSVRSIRHDGTARELARHPGAINDVAVVRGAVLGVADDDDTVAIAVGPRDEVAYCQPGRVVVDGRSLVVPGAPTDVLEAAWSPDSRTLAAATADGRVIVWDVTTGHARELAHHRAGHTHVTFANDGALIAGGSDGDVRYWRLADDRGLVIRGESPVIHLAAMASGAVALADARGEAALLDRGGVRTTLARGDALSAIAMDPGGAVWTGAWDQTIRRYPPGASAAATVDGIARGFAFPQGDAPVVATSTGLWRAGHELLEGDFRAVVPLPDGSVLAGSRALYRVDAAGHVSELLTGRGEVYTLATSRDGRRAASATLTGIDIWDTARWTSIRVSAPAQARSLALSPDGATLVATTIGTAIPVWATATGSLRIFAGPAGSNVVAFSPSGDRFATTGSDGVVRVWDPASGLDAVAHRFDGEAYDLAWTDAGIVASSADGTVWRGSGDVPIVGADRASVRAVIDHTTVTTAARAVTTE